jgi:hypothetical protein
MAQENLMLPDEAIISKIYFIRMQKVMIDRDLAELYDIETKRLKEAVKRNIERFPEDFMFEMTKDEFENWRSQFATSKSDIMGLRHAPFCFTEQGVTMLSCILRSKRAIEVNIRVVRLFIKMRVMFVANTEILQKLAELENRYTDHDRKIKIIFDYLKQLEQEKQVKLELNTREKIGFKQKKKE